MTFAHCTLAGFHTGANRPVHKINKTLTPSTLMIKLGHRLAKRDEMVIKARFSLVAVTTVLVTACAAFLTQDSRWVSRAMQQPSVKYDSHGRVSSPPTLVKIAEENWLEATLTLMIQFGLRDEQPRQWNGKLTVRGARIIRVRPWHFGADMTLSSETNTWTCSSWQGPRANAGSHTAHLPAIPRTSVRPGIQVDLTAPDVGSASLAVTTTQGDFSVRLSRLLAEGTVFLLDGGVSVSRALSSFPVAVGSQPQAEAPGGPVWHDYPSISITPGKSDEVWLCYVTYSRDHNADRIVARRLRQGRQLDQEQVVSPWGDHFGTALEHDSGGVLWAVYSAQVNGNWDLYGRSFRDRSWSTPLRLSHSPQPDLHHRLARAADGSIWLVWQGFRNGQSDILARRWDGARWGPVIQVSEKDNTGSPSNDWEPAVTPHPQGGVAVVWDRYVDGQYDLFYRLMSDRFPGTVTRATSSPEFEARPSIGVDSMRRLWIAFDRAGPDWGKDTGFWLEKAQKREGSRLVGGKGIGLVMIAPGSKRSPQPTPEVSLQLGPNELIASPKVIVDSKGKLWLFFRRQINLNMNGRGVVFKFLVESYGSRFDADSGQWTEPRLVADSSGRLDIFPDLAVTDDRLWATWATDHRAMVGRRPDISSVFAGSVSLDEISTPPRYAVASAKTEASLHAKRQPFHPNEAEDVARIRSYRIRAGSREYGIYRGDLHRHTENSNDGGGDGSLADAYRYALDAASLDFLMISDHNDGGRIYDWWRREKSNDLFRIGNSFVGLYGYERSAPYPNGHRNVLLPRRGIRPLYLSPGERGFLNQQKVLRTGGCALPVLTRERGNHLRAHQRHYNRDGLGRSRPGAGTVGRDIPGGPQQLRSGRSPMGGRSRRSKHARKWFPPGWFRESGAGQGIQARISGLERPSQHTLELCLHRGDGKHTGGLVGCDAPPAHIRGHGQHHHGRAFRWGGCQPHHGRCFPQSGQSESSCPGYRNGKAGPRRRGQRQRRGLFDSARRPRDRIYIHRPGGKAGAGELLLYSGPPERWHAGVVISHVDHPALAPTADLATMPEKKANHRHNRRRNNMIHHHRRYGRRHFLTSLPPMAGSVAMSLAGLSKTTSLASEHAESTPTGVKITGIDTFVVRTDAYSPWIFCAVRTDAGVTGYSEFGVGKLPRGLPGIVQDLAQGLIGEDAGPIERLYFDMYRRTRMASGGAVQMAIAGIELALWDIKGKLLGVPVYSLVGGPFRSRQRLYWSHLATYRAHKPALFGAKPLRTMDDVAQCAAEAVTKGFNAFKTNIIFPGKNSTTLLQGSSGASDQNASTEIVRHIVPADLRHAGCRWTRHRHCPGSEPELQDRRRDSDCA